VWRTHLRFLVSSRIVKRFLQLCLRPGGCCKTRLLLGSIWKDEGCWWKVPCVVCAERRKSHTVTYFSNATLLGGYGVTALSGWESHLYLTMTLCQTLRSLG